jgi:micrococcal nuclease
MRKACGILLSVPVWPLKATKWSADFGKTGSTWHRTRNRYEMGPTSMERTRLRQLTTAIVAAAGLLVPAVVLTGQLPAQAQAGGAIYGKAVFVDDGDTVDVNITGDHTTRPVRIRYIAIQAMELHVYSRTLSKLRGECWGVEAAKNLHAMLYKKKVRLTARHSTSKSAVNVRPLRSVAVEQNGSWVDTGAAQIDAGLALPDLRPDEYLHNGDYMMRGQRAAANHVGMYSDPAHCGVGPSQDVPLRTVINWDAQGNDSRNVNGEWVDIFNDGQSPVSLAGWWIRDAAYRGTKAHGYEFPSSAVVAPGSQIRLHVGHGDNDANTFYWGLNIPIFANVTNNAKMMGDGAWMFDPNGDLRAYQMYPCRYAC